MAKALITVAIWIFLASSAIAATPRQPPPTWAELSTEQKQVLAPLEAEWDKIDAQRRRKWIGIAKRYPSMSPEEKAKVERRMRPWASLSTEERRAARDRYKKLERMPPEKRDILKQRWDEYKQLPEEERKRLRSSLGKAPASKGPIPLSPKPPIATQAFPEPQPLAPTRPTN